MDKETMNILKILGVAIVILYLTRPKSKGKKSQPVTSSGGGSSSPSLKGSVAPPKSQKSSEDVEFDNAVISIKAVRKAIDSGEPDSEISKLNRILIKDYGLKVFKCRKTEKLIARDSKGKDIAKEE